jgi:Xaa-Pro aminopeptidase
MSGELEDRPTRPMLRIVRGEPSDEEVAALVAVLSARSAATAAPEPQARSAWSDRAALLRKPMLPGPGAWRAAVWRL